MRFRDLRLKRAAIAVLFTLLLSAVSVTNATAQTFTFGNLNYTLNDDGATVTLLGHANGQNATGELVIPENVELFGSSYPVTVIADNAFNWHTGLTGALVIPNSVITIGQSAFYHCDGFTSLTLGDAVQEIRYDAFSECHGFTGSLVIGNAVKYIRAYAFHNCGFTGTLTIPEGVLEIEYDAFRSCNGFTSLDYNAVNCHLYGSDWGGEHWLEYCSSLTNVNIGENVQSIPDWFLYNRTSITGDLVIPESVTSIGNSAFNGCTGFTGSLSIGNSVASIGEKAFYGCSSFTGSLTIPNSVYSIGANAFSGCTGFSDTLTLGLSVMQIGNTAFFGACQGFTSFNVLPMVPPTLGNNVFISADYSIPVLVTCGALEAYQNATGWSVFTNIQETDPCQWTITASANPNVGGTVSGAGTYEQGQTCTLMASPVADFLFSRWTEDGVEVSTNATYTFTVEGNRDLVAHFYRPNYIYFADANVEAICLQRWDIDGDGNLSYEEAAAVTNLGQAFRGRDDIASFDELQYFTGLTFLNDQEFYDCDALRSISLPEGITTINSNAFYSCNALSSVTLPEGLISIGSYAFDYCTTLSSIVFPEGFTTIGYGAFYDCYALSSIVFPESLTSIGQYAFRYCGSLTSLTFPESLTYIGYQAFDGCGSLSSIQVLAVVPPECGGDTFYGVNQDIPITVPCNTTLDYQNASCWNVFTNYQEYSDCVYDVTVSFSPEIAGTVTGQGSYQRGEACTMTATPAEGREFVCWLENGQLYSTEPSFTFFVTRSRSFGAVFTALPSEIISFLDPNVKAICVEHWDLDGDGELSYSEAAAVTSLGDYFQGNTEIMMFNELQYFIGLSSIGDHAFADCSLLNFMVLPENLIKIEDYAFYNCSGLIGGLTIPNSVITIGNHAFDNCSGFMGLLTIGESVQTIGDYAFNNCRNFTGSIVIPNSVVYIGNHAFYGSTAYWGTLTLGESVRTIGNYAFYGCTGLVGDIVIPNSVTTIGEWAFYDCHSFGGSLILGNSVTTIGNYAFSNCYNLSGSLEIPNSVTTIGYEAFRECTSFTGSLTFGNSVTSIGGYAFYDCYNFKGNIDLPNSMTLIGEGAFAYCYGFTGSLTIPSSVTSIGNGAFFCCYGISEVNYNVTTHADLSVYDEEYYYYWDIYGAPPFYECGGHLNIGDNVIMIPCNMFRLADFTGILTIPNSVITVRDYAFYHCDQLTGTLVIPNSMNTIGVNAFQYCTGFNQVIMGINVMIVGNRSFSNCTGLEKVILPDVVTVIGIEAFRYCNQLVEINMQAPEAPSIGWDVFADNAEGRIITIPCGTMENYSEGYWEEWADALVEMCNDNEIIVMVDPQEAGSATGGGLYDYSQICTLVATGNLGYPFLYWTRNGVVVSTEPEYSFGVTESCTYVAHFSPEPVSYDITVAVNNQEGGTVGGAGTYLHGATATLTATATEGYHFVNWTKNGMVASTEDIYSFTVTEAGNYVANFDLNSYDIIAEANPTAGGVISGAGVYSHGTTVILSASANEGYTFINWTKDGVVVTNEPTYTFTVTESGTYVANYEVNTYEIVVLAYPTEGGIVEGAGLYDHGSTCTLTATPNEGYPFMNWTKDGVAVSNELTYSFTVTEGGTYVANFVEAPVSYLVTVTIEPEEGGTVEGAGTYYHGATATLTATPNEHYYFVNWTMDGEEVSNEEIFSFEVTEAADYVANFAPYNFNIDLVVNPVEGGVADGGGAFDYGEIAIVNAEPSVGYHFVNWTENDTVVSTDADYSFMVTRDRSLTANFARNVYLIAIGVDPLQSGTITATEGYYYGDYVTLTATANVGYYFAYWTKDDELVSYNPTYSFIVTESCTMTAHFEMYYMEQYTWFNEGWNWYSTYIEQTDNNGLEQLESYLYYSGVLIKSRNDGFVEFFDIYGWSGWYGALEAIHNEQMYKILTNYDCEAYMYGYVANPADHPITIENGWNWIGFPCAQAVNLEDAMADFAPENNDIIKGKEGFATYYSEGDTSIWYGSLNSLEPGQGYMYQSHGTEPKTLTFQMGRGDAVLANITPEGNVFRPRGERYADNMTVTAIVELDGTELRSDDYELAAFAGDECRGSVKLMYVAPIDRYVAFLTVFGEGEETLRFRLTNGMETVFSDNELSFVSDGVMGSLAQPYVVQFGNLTGIGDSTTASVKVYPNPSNGTYYIEGQGINRIEVYDGLGQLIQSEENCNDFMQIDLRNHADGVYVLRVIANDGVTNNRIIKQ